MRRAETFYPLSPLQQGLLYHGLSSPGSAEYVNQFICRLSPTVDVAALERAWVEVVKRHPILRTEFLWKGLKQPVQVVKDEAKVPFAKLDLEALSPAAREQRSREVAEDERRRGFDFSSAPLMRIALLRLGDEGYEFVWSFHHILLDGWSMFLVLKEVFAYYEASAAGREISLPQPRPYRDHIVWLHRQDRAKAERFWRDRLESFEGRTSLAVDRATAVEPGTSEDSATLGIRFPDAMLESMRAACQQHGLTLNALVQGAWALLLSRYSGDFDVVFGSVVSGRPAELPGAESMVGLFINTLPLRIAVPPNERVSRWLAELQSAQSELLQYDYTPLSEIQQWSSLKRGEALFESIYLFENYHKDGSLEDMGRALGVSDVRWFERTNYPLAALAVPEERELRMIYHASRFPRSTIERMLGHWQSLLRGLTSHPDAKLHELPLLTEDERRHLQVELNDTTEELEPGRTLHGLFERSAAREPDAVAVVFDREQVSYGELERRANRLAHRLQSMGVGGEGLVGLCVERSVDMLVAVLGILKAGGAYVPLDPSHPRDRLAYTMADSGARVLVTEAALESVVPTEPGIAILKLDTDRESIDTESSRSPALGVHSANLAYVIYTSGSTGRPKGVQIQHRSVVNFLETMRRAPGMERDDVLVAVTTLSFDISILELMLPLAVGARVVVAGRETSVDAERLAMTLRRSGASVVQATPSTWRMLIESGWKGDASLKVLCGGEALPSELADSLVKRAATVWNMYGPTETTIWSTTGKVRAGEPVTIGAPIGNTQIYVLDAAGSMVPIDVGGELCIGGEGLARGYLGRPALTAEKFVPDPFVSGDPGGRLYRTGDAARWSSPGALEYLGRGDGQVKVRGFRIELGEIETALAKHPSVRQAVVVVREDVPGDARLVAYLLTTGPDGVPAGELRTHLKKTLPDYMVPASFIELESFPLTPNGKVDKKALPAPNTARPDLDAGFVGPRSPVEETVAAIWAEALGVERVGMHDDFFELGGHSLLAVRVFAEIEEKLGSRLPLASLFQARTVGELSGMLEQRESDTAWSSLVRMKEGTDDRPPFYCIHAEGGEILFYRDFAERLGDDQSVYGLQARGLDGKQPPHETIEDMARDYLTEIREVQPHGPYFLGGHCLGGVIAFEMAQQLERAGEEVALIAMLGVPAPRTTRTVKKTLGLVWTAFRRDPVGFVTYVTTSDIPARVRWKYRDLAERWSRSGASEDEVSAVLLRVREAIFRAYIRYEPKPYSGRIAYFVNEQRARLAHEKWEDFARKGLERHVFPGNLDTFSEALPLEAITARVRDYLDRGRRAGEARHASEPASAEEEVRELTARRS